MKGSLEHTDKLSLNKPKGFYERFGVYTPFDPLNAFITSPIMTPFFLASVRLFLGSWALSVTIVEFVWSMEVERGSLILTLLGYLSTVGIPSYFLNIGAQGLLFSLRSMQPDDKSHSDPARDDKQSYKEDESFCSAIADPEWYKNGFASPRSTSHSPTPPSWVHWAEPERWPAPSDGSTTPVSITLAYSNEAVEGDDLETVEKGLEMKKLEEIGQDDGSDGVLQYTLQSWSRPWKAVHLLQVTTVGTYPIHVSLIYWAFCSTSGAFTSHQAVLATVMTHIVQSSFGIFEVLCTNTPPYPWIHLPFCLPIVAFYAALGGVSHISASHASSPPPIANMGTLERMHRTLDPTLQHTSWLTIAIDVGYNSLAYTIIFTIARMAVVCRICIVKWARARRHARDVCVRPTIIPPIKKLLSASMRSRNSSNCSIWTLGRSFGSTSSSDIESVASADDTHGNSQH